MFGLDFGGGNFLSKFKATVNKLGGLKQSSKFVVDIMMDPAAVKEIGGDFDISDLKFLVQSYDLPNITLDSDGNLETKNNLGNFKTVGNGTVVPENTTFSMTFLDTETNIVESFFLRWMHFVMSPAPSTSQFYPFIRANFQIYILKNNSDMNINNLKEADVSYSYKILGAYPNHVDTPNLTYGSTNQNTRSVGFDFNKIMLDGFSIYDNTPPVLVPLTTADKLNSLKKKGIGLLTNIQNGMELVETYKEKGLVSTLNKYSSNARKISNISKMDVTSVNGVKGALKNVPSSVQTSKVLKGPKYPNNPLPDKVAKAKSRGLKPEYSITGKFLGYSGKSK